MQKNKTGVTGYISCEVREQKQQCEKSQSNSFINKFMSADKFTCFLKILDLSLVINLGALLVI